MNVQSIALAALALLAIGAGAQPAWASGISCTTTFVDGDCEPVDGPAPGLDVFAQIECEATGLGDEGEVTSTVFDPAAAEVVAQSDDPLVDAVALQAVDLACASKPAFVFAACLPAGTYRIRHLDGAGQPPFRVEGAACGPSAAGGGGCASTSTTPPPLAGVWLLLVACLVRRRRSAASGGSGG